MMTNVEELHKKLKVIYIWANGHEEVLNIKQVFEDAEAIKVVVEKKK